MKLNPFDDKDKLALHKAREALAQSYELIASAMACGVDCAETEMKRAELDRILSTFQKHFFPDYAQP